MNDLQALRSAVLLITSASDFDSFLESTDAYLRLFEKKIFPVRNNSKKSTKLYGHLAVSVWAIMTQFEFFKKKVKILPEFILIKMTDFMSLHLNLMVQSRVTDDGYVNRFKHFLLCVLKSNYEYVMIAFMKSSKTIAFCNSPVIPPLLKKIVSHIINYDRDLTLKHPLEVAWRYMFLKVCHYKFAFRNKGTLALYEDIVKYIEEKSWSKLMFDCIDKKWDEVLNVFLILCNRSALWIESRLFDNIMPYERMMNQSSEKMCTLVDIEVDVSFSIKSTCENDDILKYREIDVEFNEEETSIQKSWNTHREAFGLDDSLFQSEDDTWNIDSITTNPLSSSDISHVDSVLDYTLNSLNQFNELIIEDSTHEQQHFNINCDILDRVLCQIIENFLPDDSSRSSLSSPPSSSIQCVPNLVDSVDPQPFFPQCCQEFTMDSNQFQKWNSNLKTFQFMCEVTGSEQILYNDQVVIINRMIEITDLDFCRTEDVPKSSITLDYANRTTERDHPDFNTSYNMFVLNEKDKRNSALANFPASFIFRDINDRLQDTNCGLNVIKSVLNYHYQKPIVEYFENANEFQYYHKKLGKRPREVIPKSIYSWVASDQVLWLLHVVLDLKSVTCNELMELLHYRRRGGKRKRRRKIYRKIDGFWVNNKESNGDFSALLPIDSKKFEKLLKKYPKPGPLSTKTIETGSRSRRIRKPLVNSTKKTELQMKLRKKSVQKDFNNKIVLNGNIYSDNQNNNVKEMGDFCSIQRNIFDVNTQHGTKKLNRAQNQLNSVSSTLVTDLLENGEDIPSPNVVKIRKKRKKNNRGQSFVRKKLKLPEKCDEPDEQQSPKMLKAKKKQQKKPDEELEHRILTRNRSKESKLMENGRNNEMIIDERDASPVINGDHIISSILSDDCEYDNLHDSKTVQIRLKSVSSDDERTLSQLKLIQKRKKVRKKQLKSDETTIGLYDSDGGNNIKLACGKKRIITPKVQLTPQSKLVTVNGLTRTGMRTRSWDRHFKKLVDAEHFSNDGP